MAQTRTKICFSYSTRDKIRVQQAKAGLENLGYDVFWGLDIDSTSHQDWRLQWCEQCICADVCINFLSASYVQSSSCASEWNYAAKHATTVLNIALNGRHGRSAISNLLMNEVADIGGQAIRMFLDSGGQSVGVYPTDDIAMKIHNTIATGNNRSNGSQGTSLSSGTTTGSSTGSSGLLGRSGGSGTRNSNIDSLHPVYAMKPSWNCPACNTIHSRLKYGFAYLNLTSCTKCGTPKDWKSPEEVVLIDSNVVTREQKAAERTLREQASTNRSAWKKSNSCPKGALSVLPGRRSVTKALAIAKRQGIKTIFLEKGVHDEEFNCILVDFEVSIIGKCRRTTFVHGGFQFKGGVYHDHPFDGITTTIFGIKDLTIRGSKTCGIERVTATVHADNLLIDLCGKHGVYSQTNTYYETMAVSGSPGLIVMDGCEVKECEGCGVWSRGCLSRIYLKGTFSVHHCKIGLMGDGRYGGLIDVDGTKEEVSKNNVQNISGSVEGIRDNFLEHRWHHECSIM